MKILCNEGKFSNIIAIKQLKQNMICLPIGSVCEEVIDLLSECLNDSFGLLILKDSFGKLHTHEVSEISLPYLLALHRKEQDIYESLMLIDKLCLNDYMNSKTVKIEIENSKVPIDDYFYNLYESSGVNQPFYIFPVKKEKIEFINEKIICKYVYEINQYFDTLENSINKIASAFLPTKFGNWEMFIYQNKFTEEYHIALIFGGNFTGNDSILVRIHSECLTGDCFHSLKCDCGDQLEESFRLIQKEGKGVIIYMRQEGRGIGLINKLKAYSLQDRGADTVDANLMLGLPEDMRTYTFANAILKTLNIRKIRILTNNPLKTKELTLDSVEVERIIIRPNKYNEKYLETKIKRMNHMIGYENEKKI